MRRAPRSSTLRRLAFGAFAIACVVPTTHAQENVSTTFAVLGHIRGPNKQRLYAYLDELIEAVREVRPDFVVLTGDIIFGGPWPEDYAANLHREWDRVDSALAGIGAPIYRVPGNHDIKDLTSRDVYTERYGRPPDVVNVGAIRLLLLASGFVPADGDSLTQPHNRWESELDSSQVAFVGAQVADPGTFTHAFVFMHHLLWWKESGARWWREVHPILARGGVRAVFSGDWGPAKFSTDRRDGVEYYQSSVSPPVTLDALRGHEWERIKAQQFDHFLVVRVEGPEVAVSVRPVAAVSSGHYTPARWREVYGEVVQPSNYVSGREHLAALLRTRKGLLAVIAALGLAAAAGGGVGVLIARRR